MKRYIYVGLFLGLMLVLAACASTASTPTPVPTPTSQMMEQPPMGGQGMRSTEEPHEEDMVLSDEAKEGFEVYRTVGCASCHGAQGEGGVGPALAGHTPEQVRQQVRNPVGNMPPFSREQLSDEDLEKIVAFVQSLGGASEAHEHGSEELTPIHVHHLMTLMALEDRNVEDAEHHLQHAISLAEDEAQKQKLMALSDKLKAGEFHEVEHELQEILGAIQPEGDTSLVRLQARLALELLEQEDIPATRHAVGHLVEVATGAQKELAEDVIKRLDEGDVDGAAAHLRELLGEAGEHQD